MTTLIDQTEFETTLIVPETAKNHCKIAISGNGKFGMLQSGEVQASKACQKLANSLRHSTSLMSAASGLFVGSTICVIRALAKLSDVRLHAVSKSS